MARVGISTTLTGEPPHHTERYTGTDRTVELMRGASAGARGEHSLALRLLVEEIVRYVEPRDERSQIHAIYDYFTAHYGFLKDPLDAEQVKDPHRLTLEILRYGKTVGDCDDASTWLHAAPRTIGIQTKFVRTSFRHRRGGQRPPALTHVLAAAQDQHGHWLVLDPVAGDKTREMLGRVTRFK